MEFYEHAVKEMHKAKQILEASPIKEQRELCKMYLNLAGRDLMFAEVHGEDSGSLPSILKKLRDECYTG